MQDVYTADRVYPTRSFYPLRMAISNDESYTPVRIPFLECQQITERQQEVAYRVQTDHPHEAVFLVHHTPEVFERSVSTIIRSRSRNQFAEQGAFRKRVARKWP